MLREEHINKLPVEANLLKKMDRLYDKVRKGSEKKFKELREDLVYSNFKLPLEAYLAQYPAEK